MIIILNEYEYYSYWLHTIKSKSEIDTHRDSRELCAVGAGLQGHWDLSSSVDARGSVHWLAAAHLAAPTAQLPSSVGADGRWWIYRKHREDVEKEELATK